VVNAFDVRHCQTMPLGAIMIFSHDKSNHGLLEEETSPHDGCIFFLLSIVELPASARGIAASSIINTTCIPLIFESVHSPRTQN